MWIRDGAGELDQGGPLIQLAQECELVVPRSLVLPIVKHAFFHMMTYYEAWPSYLQGLGKSTIQIIIFKVINEGSKLLEKDTNLP